VKLAKIADYRRALDNRKRNSVPCLTAFEFSNLPGFADSKITANATFAAICGGTGVGKTTLLELMYSALTGQTVEKDHSARLGLSKAQIKFGHPNGDLDHSIDVSTLNHEHVMEPENAVFIGLPERTAYIQRAFADTEVEILKEGVASYPLDDKLLALAALICRKEYKSILVYETEVAQDKVVPFFVVEVGTTCYDSRSMATGELSVLYLAWALHYSSPLSILFIEEPEAYLPPLSHGFVFALLSYMAVTRHLSFFFTTHSTEIASSLPAGNLICIRTEGGLSVASSSSDAKMRVLSRLGLAPQRLAVLFVEDDLAIYVLKEILAIYEFNVAASVEVVQTEGAGSTKKALEAIPAQIASVLFLAALDGDIAEEAEAWDCKDSLTFLPFKLAMERESLAAIEAKPKVFCSMTGRSMDSIQDTLAASAGAEYHDRFTSMANDLSMQRGEVALHAFGLWLTLRGNRAATSAFVNDLASKLGIALPSRIGRT